jgi:putative MATE family efflux protein
VARVRRSPYDGEIVRLALPALGALAAEPLYLLADTAIVGHLGTPQLAALALAATVLSNLVALCIFLTYGTTARVTRLHGAGRDADAAALGPQALWLALAAGVLVGGAVAALAGPLVHALGGDDHVADMAARYLRIGSIGVPMALLALAGQGWLRGMSDLRTPLVIVVCANVANVVLEVVFVYGFDWGLDGSAWGTVLAQLGMAAAFLRVQLRAGFAPPDWARMRRLARVGGEIAVRTTALLGVFLVCSGVLARVGTASLGAHQIGYQLFLFIALVLDAVAIAGQVLVGRMLGGGDAAGARAAATRMIGWSVVAGVVFTGLLVALQDVLPRLFTDDGRVVDRAHEMWPLLALMMPFNGAVFALDGILIGAGDTRYLAGSMLLSAAVSIPLAVAALDAGWGIVGVWAALCAFIAVRLVTCGVRFVSGRWEVTGATL